MTDISAFGGGLRSMRWLPAIAAAGLAWNAYGIAQFWGNITATSATLMGRGMSIEQAEVYLALPGWVTASFAIGVVGGALGSVLLLLRRRLAVPVLAVSLAAYGALFAGDLMHGVFTVLPSQLAIILLVLAIAAGLLAVALSAQRRNMLT